MKNGTRKRPALFAAGALLLLVAFELQLVLSIRQQTQTVDEACHIFAGYRYWKNADFGMQNERRLVKEIVIQLGVLFQEEDARWQI